MCTHNKITYIYKHFIILSKIMSSTTNKNDNTLRTEVKIYSLYCQRHHQNWGGLGKKSSLRVVSGIAVPSINYYSTYSAPKPPSSTEIWSCG